MADKNNARVKIKLKNVRLSYAHLFKAKKFDEADEGPGKFQTRAIIDPDTKIGGINMDLIQDAIDEVIEAKWGDRPKKLKDDRLFARWADEDEEDPAMQDMYILSASNERRPLTLDRDGEDVVEADDVLYSGMYADLILTVWTQDNKYGVRVNATLEGAKERGEGERLSGAAPIDRSEFDDDDDDDDKRTTVGAGVVVVVGTVMKKKRTTVGAGVVAVGAMRKMNRRVLAVAVPVVMMSPKKKKCRGPFRGLFQLHEVRE